MSKINYKELEKKWGPVLDEGGKIRNPRVRKLTALMLENEHGYLRENGLINEAGTSWANDSFNQTSGYSGSGVFHKIAVPMVRRTFPELIAHDLVGVQPMTGPVGIAFALRYKAGQSYDGTVGTELGHNTIDKTYTGSHSTSAGEVLGSKSGSGVGDDIGLGVGSGTHIKEVNMTLEKGQVTAVTRKLRARWSLEDEQDIQNMHGLNMDEEMSNILAYEITAEIDRELVDTIDSLCTSGNSNLSTWSFSASAQGVKGRWEMERYRELYHQVVRKANLIAVATRRGAGNWILANPNASAIFETLADFTIAPVEGDISTAIIGVARIGSMGGRMSLYRDTFEDTDQYIVGFKGVSEFDTGVVYMPYIQLLKSRATYEDSFHNVSGLMTRYGLHQHLFGASRYYQKVTLSDLPS